MLKATPSTTRKFTTTRLAGLKTGEYKAPRLASPKLAISPRSNASNSPKESTLVELHPVAAPPGGCFKEKPWRIPDENSKNGRGHTVPLSDWAIEEFGAPRRLARHNRYVFPNDDGDGAPDAKLFTRGVARCLPRMKKLKIAGFTLHNLRRTCRTGLARPKIAPHIAERVLNHAQEKIPGTYDVHDYFPKKAIFQNSYVCFLRLSEVPNDLNPC